MKFLQQLFFIAVLCCCAIINASTAPRFYVGGIIGPGINYFTNDKNYVTIIDAEHASFAWNLFAGINLNNSFSLELGYLNLGFYENAGSGQSICDTKGNCGYPEKIPFQRFNTNLTVINDINAQFYYLDLVSWLLQTEHWRIFAKVGAAYDNISLKSYVTVFPNFDDLGFQIQQTVNSKSSTQYSPHLALGYEYQANEHLFIRTEVDYFSSQSMVSTTDGSSQGTLFPLAILFGTRITF
jgi:hypothetical protein